MSGFLVIGGLDAERNCEKYDPISKQRLIWPDLQSDRVNSTSAKIGENVYVFDGETSMESYEMINVDEPFSWTTFETMLEARHSASSCSIQDEIYVSGGVRDDHKLSSCVVFNANTGRWRNSTEMLQKRARHGMCSINNAIYCFGGYDGKRRLCMSERRDIRSATSTVISCLNQGRSYLAGVEIDGKIYAIGGLNNNGDPVETVERYVPETDSWEMIAPLLGPRWEHSACVVNNKIHVVGGFKSFVWEPIHAVEVYDVAANCWSESFQIRNPVEGSTVVAV